MTQGTPAGRLSTGAGPVVLVAAFFVLLVAAGDGPLGPLGPPPADPRAWAAWLATHPPEVAAAVVVRVLALAAGGYLALACVAAAVAGAARSPGAVAAIERAAPPGGRALVRAAAAAGLALTSLAPAGVAAAVDAAPVDDPPVLRPLDEPAELSPATRVDSARPTPDESRTVGEGTWDVRAGDHLWAVAERTLTDAWGRAPSDAEVAPYWMRVVDANRSRLADPANPDLIYPGQVLVVPAPPAA